MLWEPAYVRQLLAAERGVLARQQSWDPREYVPHEPPAGGGGGGSGGAFALIASKTGTEPPYRYAAVQATMDTEGYCEEVEDGTAYQDVFNLEELGSGGQWVNPLNIGDPVIILSVAGVALPICLRSHYRGTY